MLILIAPPGSASATTHDHYDNAVVIWQSDNPSCFPADKPLREQMAVLGRFIVGGDISEPRKIKGPMPATETFEGIKIVPGVPIFELVINEEGAVESVISLRPLSPDFDARLGDLLAEWRFEPATENGDPLCVRYVMTIRINWQ